MFKSVEKIVNGVTYVFVTGQRSRPFSAANIQKYFDSINAEASVESVKEEFFIREKVVNAFLKDIRQMGVKFCMNKYGGTKDEIISEAKKLAPYLRGHVKK